MAKLHVVSALLLGTPLLQSCASAPTVEPYGAKAGATNVRYTGETPAAYYQVGRYYQGQNRFDAAAIAYEKALSLDSGYFEARNGLGVIYSARGKLDLAVEQFLAAIAQSPRSAHLHNNLAQAYYLQGKFQDAVASFETAVTLDPGNYGALARLSQAYAKAGFSDKSQQALRTAQSSQAQSSVAAQSILGRPGAIAAELTPSKTSAAAVSVAAPVQRPAAVGVQGNAATAPARTVTNTEVIASHSEITGKLVPISPNVYELVVPGSVASTASLPPPVMPQLAQSPKPAIPARLEPAKTLTVTSIPSADVKITSAAPGVYQMETSTQASSSPVATAVAVISQPSPGTASLVSIPPSRTANSRVPSEVAKSGSTPGMTLTIDRIRLEVANGNGVRGIAKRVSTKLKQLEHYVARLSNQRPIRSDTSIEYRDGYIEEAASLAATLQKPVALIPSDNLRRDIHVRLVLGRDVRSELALLDPTRYGESVAKRAPAARNPRQASQGPEDSVMHLSHGTGDLTVEKLIRAAGSQASASSTMPGMAVLAKASVNDGRMLIVWQ